MNDPQNCKQCGKPVLMQIQKNTGFCRADCKDDWLGQHSK